MPRWRCAPTPAGNAHEFRRTRPPDSKRRWYFQTQGSFVHLLGRIVRQLGVRSFTCLQARPPGGIVVDAWTRPCIGRRISSPGRPSNYADAVRAVDRVPLFPMADCAREQGMTVDMVICCASCRSKAPRRPSCQARNCRREVWFVEPAFKELSPISDSSPVPSLREFGATCSPETMRPCPADGHSLTRGPELRTDG